MRLRPLATTQNNGSDMAGDNAVVTFERNRVSRGTAVGVSRGTALGVISPLQCRVMRAQSSLMLGLFVPPSGRQVKWVGRFRQESGSNGLPSWCADGLGWQHEQSIHELSTSRPQRPSRL